VIAEIPEEVIYNTGSQQGADLILLARGFDVSGRTIYRRRNHDRGTVVFSQERIYDE